MGCSLSRCYQVRSEWVYQMFPPATWGLPDFPVDAFLGWSGILCRACSVKRKSCRWRKAEINPCLSSLSPHFLFFFVRMWAMYVTSLMFGICAIYMLTANARVYVFCYLSHAEKLAILGATYSGSCSVGLSGSLCWQWWRILTSGLAGGPSALFHIKSLQHWGGIFPFDILVSIMASCSFAGQ